MLIAEPQTIGKFHASRKHTEEVTGATLPFLLQVSNRGQTAQTVYSMVSKMPHSSILHLVGGSLRHDRLQRPPLAKALASTLS